MKRSIHLWTFAAIAPLSRVESNPKSDPIFNGRDVKQSNAHDFVRGEWDYDSVKETGVDELYSPDQCPLQFKLTHVKKLHGGAAIIGTPTVLPLRSDQPSRQAVVPSFAEQLDVMDFTPIDSAHGNGDHSYAFETFPMIFEGSLFYGNGVVHDVDGDGVEDVVMVDFDGRLIVVPLDAYATMYNKDEHGNQKFHWGYQMPRLYVRKNWYEALNGDDANDEKSDEEKEEEERKKRYEEPYHSYFEYSSEWITKKNNDLEAKQVHSRRKLLLINESVMDNGGETNNEHIDTLKNEEEEIEKVHEADTSASEFVKDRLDEHVSEIEEENLISETGDDDNDEVWKGNNAGDDDEVDVDERSFDDMQYYGGDDYHRMYMYDDMYRHDYYDDNYFSEDNYVALEPHVLSSPTVALFQDEVHIVVGASYFFEENEYKHLDTDEMPLPLDEMKNYAASAILSYNVNSRRWSTQEHLDLSSKSAGSSLNAMTYCTPTIIDLDGDSIPEVIIGTSLGLLYVMSKYGTVRTGFPIQMGAIYAQVAVADVTGSPALELFAADMEGNVVCLDSNGLTIWHYNVQGEVIRTPKLGDIDGDGNIDLVVVSKSSDGEFRLWSFNASNGELLENFPMVMGNPSKKMFRSSLHPDILLVDLHTEQDHWLDNSPSDMRNRSNNPPGHGGVGRGLHIVVPSHNYLYIIEASTGCINRLDVGDVIRNMVLADDIGNGQLSLVVSTISGEILTFETPVLSHPLNTWSSPLRSRLNGFVQGYSSPVGIIVSGKSTEFRDVLGFFINVSFEIFDRRELPKDYSPKFVVQIGVGSGNKKIRLRKEYTSPGKYLERIALTEGGEYSTLVVSLTTENGLYFEEMFAIGYNVNYGKGIEWLLALPMIIAAIPLMLYRKGVFMEGGSLLGTTVNQQRSRIE